MGQVSPLLSYRLYHKLRHHESWHSLTDQVPAIAIGFLSCHRASGLGHQEGEYWFSGGATCWTLYLYRARDLGYETGGEEAGSTSRAFRHRAYLPDTSYKEAVLSIDLDILGVNLILNQR